MNTQTHAQINIKRYTRKTQKHKQTHMHKEKHTHRDGCFNNYDRLDMQLIQGNYMESQDRKTCWEVTTSKMDITGFNRLWY
jgi:hypothetical protein